MRTPDRKPLTSVIDVPQASDSNSGRPVIVDAQAESGRSVHRFRNGIGRVLVFGGTLALATFGFDAKDTITDHQKDQVRSAIAEAERVYPPIQLLDAQSQASSKLFGGNIKEAERITHTLGTGEILSAKDYLPAQVQVSEDGEGFIVDGQSYSLLGIKNGGDQHIVAGRTVVEEKIFGENKAHVASPLIVGGARNDASSDRNNDGVVTEEEVRETAYEDARNNLSEAFAPKEKLIIEGNKITEVSQK